MKFYCDTGTLELNENLTISPFMKKKDIFSQNVVWEEWFPRNNGVVLNYRTALNINENNVNEKITVIIHFDGASLDNASVKSWLFAPSYGFSGVQKKPEGKITKDIRVWFDLKTSKKLPIAGDWGRIDAAYDPHNQTAEIVCLYNR